MNDFQREFFAPAGNGAGGDVRLSAGGSDLSHDNNSNGTAATTATAPKKRILTQYENGLAAHSLDPMMLRPEAEVVAAEGLASVSFDPDDVGGTVDGGKSKKKQRGHRRTMDYLQNFSIQALMSLGQNGKDSPNTDTSAGITFATATSRSSGTSSSSSGGSRLNGFAGARPGSLPNVPSRYPAFQQSPYASALAPSLPPPSSSAFDGAGGSARSRRRNGGVRADTPPEGTTLPPKPAPTKSAYKNVWPASMLANVVSLAQVLMTSGGPPREGPAGDDTNESVDATGSVTTHGDVHGQQVPGAGEPPLDALASRSLSTDSYDSRSMRQMWNDHLRIGDREDTWRDCPTPDTKDGSVRARSSS